MTLTASLLARGGPVDRLRRKLQAPMLARQSKSAVSGLADLAGNAPPLCKRILFDATYDNPNYWLRVSLVRRALGTAAANEAALLGTYSVKSVSRTLDRLGIVNRFDLTAHARDEACYMVEAKRKLSAVHSPREFVDTVFDCGIPAVDIYDGALKRQRLGSIDLSDVRLPGIVAETLRAHDAAAAILDEFKPDVFVTSHTASGNTPYGAIVWAALSRGIDVLVPWGTAGQPRFFRLKSWDDCYAWSNTLEPSDLDTLSPAQLDELAASGRRYLDARLSGTTDTAAALAYVRPQTAVGRESLGRQLGWNPSAPIVCVYASVWFDNPHVFGMEAFTDFEDWLMLTHELATRTPDINFIFKPHPSELFYGGPSLSQMFAKRPEAPNIAVADHGWNGRELLSCIDAVVTLHGTVGVEAGGLGIPVLAGAPGWYDRLGFVRRAADRDEYCRLMSQRWWDGWDGAQARRRAEIFAGWHFGANLERLRCGEDHDGASLWPMIAEVVRAQRAEFEAEAELVRKWWLTGETNLFRFLRRQQIVETTA